jgi:hypothetical protein
MICPNCHKDVEGIWEENDLGRYHFICEECESELETEDSYDDHISDMMEDSGRYREDDF